MSQRSERKRARLRALERDLKEAFAQVRQVQIVTDKCIGMPTKINESFALFEAWLKYWQAIGITLDDEQKFDRLKKAAGL